MVGVLRDHGSSESLAAAALSVLFLFTSSGKLESGLARDGGAVEAAVAALRAFPSSRAVNEFGWVVLNRIIAPLTGPFCRPGNWPKAQLDRAAAQRLVQAGGPELALAALPRFRHDATVSQLLIGAIHADLVADAERAPASQCSAYIQARRRRRCSRCPFSCCLASLNPGLLLHFRRVRQHE